MTGPVVLLLEDEALIAIDVADMLARQGYDVVTLGSCADALDWLSRNPAPDLAVIDVKLVDGSCDEAAAILKERGVPFLVHAGMLEGETPGEPFTAGILVPKPSTHTALLAAVQKASQGRVAAN